MLLVACDGFVLLLSDIMSGVGERNLSHCVIGYDVLYRIVISGERLII